MTDRPDPTTAGSDPLIVAEKQTLRTQLLVSRGERTVADRVAAQRANAEHVRQALAGSGSVCAFIPLASEPVSTDLLDELADSGLQVLVPIVAGHRPLDWVDYSAARVNGQRPTRGPLGIAQLGGARLGAAAVAGVPTILVPALAIDPHGYRLGRGGGHYDRTLALVHRMSARPTLIGVVFDEELLPFVPHDDLDVPVHRVIAPARGLLELQ